MEGGKGGGGGRGGERGGRSGGQWPAGGMWGEPS